MDFIKRKLDPAELNVLLAILPADKPAYNKYRKRLEEFFVIGYGRFGSHNLVLGKPGDEPDFTLPSSPVFAFGEAESGNIRIDVTIHEEEEEKIEVEIVKTPFDAELPSITPDRVNSLSFFGPVDPDPAFEPLRTVELIKDGFYLSFLIHLKKILLTDISSGYNALVPVSNFYNELMFVKNIRDPKIALKPQLFFNDVEHYTDSDFKEAFIRYNKIFRRAEIEFNLSVTSPSTKEGFLSKIFKGKA